MAAVFLLFFFIVTSVPQLMNSVLTEKTSRISEVLLGSLSPTELMTGKLLGSVAVSLLLGTIYLTAGLSVAGRMGYAGAVPPALIAWFLVFLVLAMLLYGSVSMAIGAACNDVKDAQNLMLPVMLPLMMPMFVLLPVIESPSSALSVGMSLFPPATPLVMLLRVALHPTAPAWQVATGALLTLLTTAFCIWAAGRIFRIGLLLQGKSAAWRRWRAGSSYLDASAEPYCSRCAGSFRALLGDELVDERDVPRLRLVARQPLLAAPGVELGASADVEHARPLAGHVALGGLLVERVELEQLVGRRRLRQRLHARLGVGELLVEVMRA